MTISGSTAEKRYYALGGTSAINSDASMKIYTMDALYGSTVTVSGEIEAGEAINNAATTSSPLSITHDLIVGNRGSNVLNISNAVTIVDGDLKGSDDAENGGSISEELVNFLNYKPSSIPANTISTINLDNAILKANSVSFGTAGVGKTVNLKNKSKLISTTGLTLTANDTISMGWDSKITTATWTNNGSLEIDINGLTATEFDSKAVSGKIVVVTASTNITGIKNVTLKNNSGYSVLLDGTNIAIKKAEVTVTHGSTTTGYSSVEAALEAALTGDTITLQQNATLTADFAVADKKKLTLDINGYVLTETSDYEISVAKGAELTIKDSYNGGISGAPTAVVVNGTLNVQSGFISGSNSAITLADKSAKVTISGGTISKIIAPKGTLEVSKGTITDVVIGENGATDLAKAIFTGGTIETAITVVEKFDSVSVTSTLTDIIDSVTPPSDAYVWVTSSGMSNLVTLEDALNKSAAGSTVKLSKNIETASAIDVAKEVTLDLNGHWIKGTGSTYVLGVKNGAKLTLINTSSVETSAGESVGIISTTCPTAIRMNPDNNRAPSAVAELIVGSASDSGSNGLTIKGTTYGIGGAENYTNTSVTINGGTITTGSGSKAAAIYSPQKQSKVIINNGTISSPVDAVYVSSGSTLTINNGYVGNGTSSVGVHIEQKKGGDAITVDILGGEITGTNSIKEDNKDAVNNVNICVGGGNIGDTILADNARGFLEGGRYVSDPSKGTYKDYLVSGATVTELSGTYKYQITSDVKRYTVSTTYTTGGSSSAPTVSPSGAQKSGTAITVTAGPAATGYKFDGWYESDKLVGTAGSLTYKFNITANRTLEARYLKELTITAPTENISLGQEYKGTASLIKVTGLLSSDTESAMVDKSAAVITAASYKKDTAKIGDTFDTSVTGVKLTTAGAKKYYIGKTETGKLTVIESATAEAFVKAVNALPAADKATTADRTAIDAAKTMYDGLTAAEKNEADVKTAKTKLDAVDAAVKKQEDDKAAADAVKAQIDALPAADKATAADKKAADEAKAAYDKLTDDQKKLISDADKKKLDDVKAAADKAAEDDKKAADAVATEINAIPALTDITLDDKAAVEKARKDFDALTEAQKALIPDSKTKLEAAEDVIKALEGDDQKKADEVSALISALPSPDDAKASDRAQVDAAKAAYNALTPAQQALVTPANKNKLNDVDKAVKKAEDQQKADAVEDLIEAIKDAPAGEQKAAAQEARAAYYGLTTDQRALLPDEALDDLEEAEAAFEEGRVFGLNGQQYKVLSNGDVTYHRPQNRKEIESVNIPNQIKKGGYLFKVVKVSINAFNACPKLKWVVVGKNVKSLGKCAFKNTPVLQKVKFMGTQVTTATSAFTGAGSGSGKSKGANLRVLTKASVVDEYEELFKGAGKLNAKATVEEMA